MEKINFVNNSTPYLNADNLNQMQTNFENAIHVEVITATLTVEAGNTSGNVSVNLPEGYTRQNSAVIFKNYDIGTGNKTDSPNIGATIAYNSYDNLNYIYIVLADLNTSTEDRTFIVNVGIINVDYSGGTNE